MTLPYQEHNSLIICREFLLDLTNPEKIPDVPEKVRLNAEYLLKNYPSRSRLDELYEGKSIQDFEKSDKNKVFNNNQTWQTSGYKWKTEVEFFSAENSKGN